MIIERLHLIYDLGSYSSIDELNEEIKQSETVFDDMRDYSGSVEKNTTALYLLKTGKKIDTAEPLWHKICEIEEIVTYMKRNVLCYTENEQIEVNKIEGCFSNEITSYLMKTEKFTSFKKDRDLRYEILSKIFIKMHCMKYIFDPNNFPDIDKGITNLIMKDNILFNNLGLCKNLDDDLDEVIEEKVSEDKIIDDYTQNLLQNSVKSIDDLVNERINKRLQGQVQNG